MEIERSIIEALVEEIAKDPTYNEAALANAFCFPVRDFRNITTNDLFKQRVIERRVLIQREIAEARLAGKDRKDPLKQAEELSTKRLLKEMDDDASGTPASRVAAAKAVLDATKRSEALGALILVEMAPEKFQQIFNVRPSQTELAGETIRG